jgi:hypothetical protein
MKASSMSQTDWSGVFAAGLARLGATTPLDQLVAKGRELWALIGDVHPDAVAKQEFMGWVLPVRPH